jgi:hypothetical protein
VLRAYSAWISLALRGLDGGGGHQRGGALDLPEGDPVRVCRVALFAVLMFADLSAIVFAQSPLCPGIHIKILNIRNRNGTVIARCSTLQRASSSSVSIL